MRINIRGVRGSIPVSGHDVEYYGGNTSCSEVTAQGWKLVLDGGSGIRNVNWADGLEHKRVDILLTHLHMDHIQGLGFFNPLFDPSMEVHIWGPASNTQSLQLRLSRYLSPPLFPVWLRELPSKLEFHEIENSRFEIGPFQIQSAYIIHPGPTVGYRINHNSSVFTYIPDHEPALGLNGILKDHRWISGIDLARGADILLHDAQYSLEEYYQRIGWGHSSMDDAILFASMAEVKNLLMAHHDPSHPDDVLNNMLGDLKEKSNNNLPYQLAAEGMEMVLPL